MALENEENKEEKNIEIKSNRMIDILFRAMKGEALSVKELSEEYGTSSRSISRDISALNNYFADHRDIMGNSELQYDAKSKRYTLQMEEFLTGLELLSLLKILIASRGLSHEEMITIIGKLKKHASPEDRKKLEHLINKELYNYAEMKFDCSHLLDQIWELTDYIENHRYITINYIKMSRDEVKHRIMPVSLMFSEYYFYLIAYECDNDEISAPKYFRVDRIVHITAHRETFHLPENMKFDESLLRKRSQFMWPGPLRRIRFEFYGPSVQSILDRIPTAKIIEKLSNGYLVEAEVYGDGIKMFLLSQGSWVKVVSPTEFVTEMKNEIEKMRGLY